MNSKIAAIASSQVGQREATNHNDGAAVRKYQAATNLEPDSWPWCAAFVCWCVREWLKDPSAVSWLSLKKLTPEEWRPKNANAWGFSDWSHSRPATTKIIDRAEQAKPGDIVMFTFSHVGIVVSDNGKSIQTVEGNTNGVGERDGDGVYFKTRSRSLVKAYVRIHPSTA
jgi:hypothetical protein